MLVHKLDEVFFTLLEDGKPEVVACLLANLNAILLTMHTFIEPIKDQQVRVLSL